jgi:hypothetical protein
MLAVLQKWRDFVAQHELHSGQPAVLQKWRHFVAQHELHSGQPAVQRKMGELKVNV